MTQHLDRLTIYGSVTSPYVRRVRMVAMDLGLPHELIDTIAEQGQAEMRQHNPLWKVPTVQWLRGQKTITTFDSRVIIESLWAAYGFGSMRPYDPLDIDERNTLNVLDGALDSAVNVFYLKREGVDVTAIPYMVKQSERVVSAMDWLQERLSNGWFSTTPRFGYSELAAFTMFEWFRFRQVLALDKWPALAGFTGLHHERFVATRPYA